MIPAVWIMLLGHRGLLVPNADAFVVPAGPRLVRHLALFAEGEEAPENPRIQEAPESRLSEKMAAWEEPPPQQKTAGLVPGSSGTDSFDIGLWLAFPPLFASLCLFLLFPFLRESIDVSDLAPPQA
ncbi:hypothetical protein CTAYLR_007797 [Chrysophaeum taylorii]|uniref:Uncharacterized protein n=1 Tax=Chrysophaeum taylorii TaxID=2483200 RepID=A0AAD7XS50_9STRA|nr:hypothetical protein CTAYLR_010250 [Chrysophaeum taylorii]KAJ8608760.1 hypothetical protein CTAYLR_007797 [Chrysophaeum taylorii]